ncbi:MAG: helix-turn-helix transcriptional regulator [Patescibacteria group bacterium]
MKNINKITAPDPISEVRDNKDFQQYSRDAAIRIRLAVEIHSTREAQGLSQQELAKEIHTTQRVISNIENGDINIGLDLLNRLVTQLNFSADQLSTVFGITFDSPYTTKTQSSGSSVVGTTSRYVLTGTPFDYSLNV